MRWWDRGRCQDEKNRDNFQGEKEVAGECMKEAGKLDALEQEIDIVVLK